MFTQTRPRLLSINPIHQKSPKPVGMTSTIRSRKHYFESCVGGAKDKNNDTSLNEYDSEEYNTEDDELDQVDEDEDEQDEAEVEDSFCDEHKPKDAYLRNTGYASQPFKLKNRSTFGWKQ